MATANATYLLLTGLCGPSAVGIPWKHKYARVCVSMFPYHGYWMINTIYLCRTIARTPRSKSPTSFFVVKYEDLNYLQLVLIYFQFLGRLFCSLDVFMGMRVCSRGGRIFLIPKDECAKIMTGVMSVAMLVCWIKKRYFSCKNWTEEMLLQISYPERKQPKRDYDSKWRNSAGNRGQF